MKREGIKGWIWKSPWRWKGWIKMKILLPFIHVDVTNISRSGIGFFSNIELVPNTFYNSKIQIWTKEIVNAVIKIARCVPEEEGFSCGGVFIGLAEADALKIDIYEMYSDKE